MEIYNVMLVGGNFTVEICHISGWELTVEICKFIMVGGN